MRLIVVLFALWANTALAQTYPSYQNTTVNDYAELLSAADEATLSKQLRQLKSETGVEMTVLTLNSRSEFAPNKTLEQFATGLFNKWGIGDKTRNDGILVMILRGDRAMRIELGAGYKREWDKVAQRIVDGKFLPAFRNDNYTHGILQGSTAVIDQIALPFYKGDAAPAVSPTTPPRQSDKPLDWGIFAGFAAIFALIKGRGVIGDQLARLRKCPKCGQRTLKQSRKIKMAATVAVQGSGLRRVVCTNCDYEAEHPYIISRLSSGSSGSSGSFGGGRSGGGGASGRW